MKTTTTSRVYLKVSADTNEILAETVATSRQQAMRKLKVDESNLLRGVRGSRHDISIFERFVICSAHSSQNLQNFQPQTP